LQFDPEDIDLSDLTYTVNDDERFYETKMDEEPLGPQFAVDEAALATLLDMGFSVNRCTRALSESGNNVENAMNLIFSTMEDLTWDEPPQPKKAAEKKSGDNDAAIWEVVNNVWPMLEGLGLDQATLYKVACVKVNP
jgi:uncharacterized UBP type Zn finger protein